MKKLIAVLALLLALTMCLSVFAACNKENDDKKDDGTEESSKQNEATDKVKVYWYEGTKELRVDEVEKGTKITSWTPTSEAGEFDGWYAEASKETPFDFEQVINEDTDIFAKFKSNEFAVDANEYYLIGGGAGDLAEVSWDHAKAAANLMMTKEANDTANIYTVTLKMYAGDMFQICYGGAWDGQTGIGHVKGAEYCDGINSYDKKEYTAADKKVAQVKNEAGEVVFVGSDEYNKGYEVWNIALAEGQDGIYKFTFTTNPAAKEYNEITYELVEKVEAQTQTHDMHLVGTFNEWNASDDTEAYRMTVSQDGKTWTGYITVEEGATAEFKVVNQINSSWLSNTEGNMILAEAGTYAVRYTVEGDVIEIAKLEYYVVGTFVDEAGAAVNFAVKEGVTPKLENGTATFTATDVTSLGDYSWIADQGKPGVMAVKVVYGCELGIKDWYSDDANGGDNWYITAGEHTVTLTFGEDGAATVTVA